jgi:type III restriction enzyme
VPASEGDFVQAIQSEISDHSVRKVARVVSQESLAASGVSMNPFVTVALFQALEQCGAGALDMATGTLTLQADATLFRHQRLTIEQVLRLVPHLTPVQASAMLEYLDAYYDGAGQVKKKQGKEQPTLAVNAAQYEKFKHLWENPEP